MKILKNLFGNNTKIATSEIADETGRLLSDSVIVESGSNENGSWIKFADGTMICQRNFSGIMCNVTEGPLKRSNEQLWDYPQPFIGTGPTLSTYVRRGWGYVWTASGATNSTILIGSFVVMSAQQNITNPLDVMATAIGRWK